MNCDDVRPLLLDYERGRLAPEPHDDIAAHLESCAACARAHAVENVLTEVLEQRLPQHVASIALKRRLAERWPSETPVPRARWWPRWNRAFVPALAAVAVVALVVVTTPLVWERPGAPDTSARLVAEAVNDHLRVLASQRPLEVESGGLHQVKPWFAGRLDFAPDVPFGGDAEFPLRGGAIGYVFDRKAAVFVYARRLHTISLFVFPAGGLAWPTRDLEPLGDVSALVQGARGFTVILWRRGDLGYALVSDVDARELRQLAVKLSPGSRGT
jgi:anti-sigma factor RsiW